uniref:Portal protein n=1 Tax=viral metagenome TaxID=1070528 RepID=A0A6M3KXV7_9ZZZZ
MALSDPPNMAEIEAQLVSQYAARNTLMDEMDSLRFMEREVEVPAEMESEIVRSPMAYQIVERTVGTLTTDDPQITVPPASEKQGEVERSSKVERFFAAFLDEMPRQQGVDTLARFVECQVALGAGCMRVLYAPQMWRGYPKRDKKSNESDADYNKRAEEWKRGKPIPISWQYVDPRCVYPVWSEMGLEQIMEVDYRDVITLNTGRWNQQKPDLLELSRAQGTPGKIKFSQLWTADALTYAVGGEVVHHQKHGYQRPPYVYAHGIATSSRKAELAGISVLYPLRFLLPYLDRLLSQKATAVRLWCWPTPIVKLLDLPTEGEGPRTIEVQPGKTVTLFPGEEVSWLVWSGNGPDADEMVSLIMNMAERAGLADVAYGQVTGESGYAINQLLAATRMKWKPIVAHAERSLEHVLQATADIIEYQVEQPLYIYNASNNKTGWLSLGPDDLNGYRQVRVKLNPILPTDSYAISSRTINEVNNGLRSKQSGMEQIGIEQPDEMDNQILMDKWKERPEVQAWLTEKMLERANIKLEQRQPQFSAEQMAQVFPTLPPALQQALAQGIAPGVTPGQGGGMGAGVMAAPGVQAVPTVAQQGSAQATPPQVLGRMTRPAGVATGRAPGAKRQGNER